MADKKADFSDVQSGSSSTGKKADFSEVQSGSSSTAPSATGARTYTVVAGDSLSKIAKQLLGKASRWPEIHQFNKDIIKNPDLIHPGQVFKIPDK